MTQLAHHYPADDQLVDEIVRVQLTRRGARALSRRALGRRRRASLALHQALTFAIGAAAGAILIAAAKIAGGAL